MRWKAIYALGAVGGEKATEALLAALQDESAYVRFAAAKTLGGLGDPRTIDSLIQVLKEDESPNVRGRAAWALGNIGVKSGLESLLASLKDLAWEVRWAATLALGVLDNMRAFSPLHAILQDKDENIHVR